LSKKSRSAPVFTAKFMFSGRSPVTFAILIAFNFLATTPTTLPLISISGPPLFHPPTVTPPARTVTVAPLPPPSPPAPNSTAAQLAAPWRHLPNPVSDEQFKQDKAYCSTGTFCRNGDLFTPVFTPARFSSFVLKPKNWKSYCAIGANAFSRRV